MQTPSNTEKLSVLFVDDEHPILKAMRRLGRSQGWDVTLANSGQEALELLEEFEFDVIVSDMRMPHMSGAELLEHAAKICPFTVRIILSGYSDKEALQHAINKASIYRFLTKPWLDEELIETILDAMQFRQSNLQQAQLITKTEERSRTLGKVALLLDKKAKERDIEVEQAMSIINTMNLQAQSRLTEALGVLNQIVEWREGRDAGHSRFVGRYAEKIAKRLEWNEKQSENLLIASMLHRIGMVCLPDNLCSRPVYDLSKDQKVTLASYPVWGEKALKQANNLKNVAKIIRHHREFVNGTGFPDQLTDKDIPIESKIICVVGDFFDAFNGRLEKNISGSTQAIEYIKSWVGKRYDKEITDHFLEVLDVVEDSCWQIKTLRSNELAPGMIVDSDVVANSGVLLLKKGSKLTGESIKHIQDFESQNREQYSLRVVIDICRDEAKTSLEQEHIS